MKSKEERKKPKVVSQSDYKLVKKSWGYERWIINTPDYCGKELMCSYGKWSSKGRFHYHLKKDETFYIVSGFLELETLPVDLYGTPIDYADFGIFFLRRHQSIRIRPQVAHRFRSKVRRFTRFYEFSTHHEDSDSYYLD